MVIDLNCDMGEGTGVDADLMPYISSANIACGYHAGTVKTIIETIKLAKKYGVAIGAHPSFPDRENFGRTEMQLSSTEVYEIVSVQIKFLSEVCRTIGVTLHHVKPHGALYNMSAKSPELATTIAKAIKGFDNKLILLGLSGSYSISEAKAIGLKTSSEAFADRNYQDDGSLVSRNQQNALINDVDIAVAQALQIAKERVVTTVSGKKITLIADSICIHGDGKHAVKFAKNIHDTFEKENIKISVHKLKI